MRFVAGAPGTEQLNGRRVPLASLGPYPLTLNREPEILLDRQTASIRFTAYHLSQVIRDL